MSWDAYLYGLVDGNAVELVWRNYTHNTNRMVRAAGFEDWATGLGGMTGEEAGDALDAVLAEFDRDPDRFRAMNPENGWGDFDSLRLVLATMRDYSRKFPSARWEVSV